MRVLVSKRHLPVRPDLDQLRRQAKDLLHGIQGGDDDACAELAASYPGGTAPDDVKLADAQFALARSYGVATWPRLVLACRLTDAIWRDDVQAVRALIDQHPVLLSEDARGVRGNWGPPMSYAANLGRNEIVAMLRARGAEDVQFAFDRACLQGQLETARLLHDLGARPEPGAVMGPCETLNAEGLRFLLDLGAAFADEGGDRHAPIGLMLETYSRAPAGKHACLEIAARHGITLPDTPVMALHRGRLDLLEAHLRADPDLLARRFGHEEIYPPALGCHPDPTAALHGTPLAGTTLLHIAIDFDEMEILHWLLARGANVDARAAIDADGFGGHTPLFHTVIVQPIWMRHDGRVARLLLERGADPNARASLRKELRGVDDESLHEYRDVTPVAWGRRFHDRQFVSQPALEAIVSAGGLE
jgi:ankyrin repeat protein